jgi:hypothetical protein
MFRSVFEKQMVDASIDGDTEAEAEPAKNASWVKDLARRNGLDGPGPAARRTRPDRGRLSAWRAQLTDLKDRRPLPISTGISGR